MCVCARFEVLIVQLLQIKILECCVASLSKSSLEVLKVQWSFSAPGNTCPVTQHYIPVDFNHQQFDISVRLYRNFCYLLLNTAVIFHVRFSTDFGHFPSTFISKTVGTCWTKGKRNGLWIGSLHSILECNLWEFLFCGWCQNFLWFLMCWPISKQINK